MFFSSDFQFSHFLKSAKIIDLSLKLFIWLLELSVLRRRLTRRLLSRLVKATHRCVQLLTNNFCIQSFRMWNQLFPYDQQFVKTFKILMYYFLHTVEWLERHEPLAKRVFGKSSFHNVCHRAGPAVWRLHSNILLPLRLNLIDFLQWIRMSWSMQIVSVWFGSNK